MPRSMFDSTNPNACPKSAIDGNSGGILIAYYPYAFSSPTKSSFPSGTLFVTIDQSTSASHPDCDILDVEPGCASPSQVPGWLVAHKAATGKQGTIYCNTSTKPSIPNTQPYYWWAAEWTDSSSTQPSGATATQYASRGSYDASTVFDASWPPGAAPAPTPTPAPSSFQCTTNPPGTWHGEIELTGTGTDGNKWYTNTGHGAQWTAPSRSSAINYVSGSTYSVTKPPPGWWKGTIVLGGNGTDGNRWHTSSSNGSHWAGPFRTNPSPTPTPAPTGTPTLVEGATWAVAHNSQFIYDEIRPVKLPAWNNGNPLGSGTWTGDCSSFITLLAHWAGLPDPNGPSYNYNGDGNGATLYSNLPSITQAEAVPGDVVGFGEIHVAMMMQNGTESNPNVASFGEQGDPRIWSLSAVEADTSSNLWFRKL